METKEEGEMEKNEMNRRMKWGGAVVYKRKRCGCSKLTRGEEGRKMERRKEGMSARMCVCEGGGAHAGAHSSPERYVGVQRRQYQGA